jgi:beta-lactamase class A
MAEDMVKPTVLGAVGLCLLSVLSVAARTQPAGLLQRELKKLLETRLEGIASRLDGVLGYVIVDLSSNERVATRLDREPFPTASAIKLAILYELLKQGEEGKQALEKPVPLERAQVVGGSGVLQHLSVPILSLIDHAALMMIVSDNTATDVIIDTVGMNNLVARMNHRLHRFLCDRNMRASRHGAGPSSHWTPVRGSACRRARIVQSVVAE